MAYGVFIHRQDSIYDDSPAERYQFPKQYLSRVKASLGDWIIYYEPTKVIDTKGYFGVARVQQIIEDPRNAGMHIAIIDPGSYLDFARPVDFSGSDGIVEQGLLNADGRISGRAQAAVRTLSAQDFNRIISLGFEDDLILPRLPDMVEVTGLREDQTPFAIEDRQRTEFLANRIVRDRVFRRRVLSAYDERCAVTGLKLINGGGRAEVTAAHIRPVEFNGPDVINNGIALSGTAHWMFDRGLISLSDDLEILVSRQANDPEGIRSFINANARAMSPARHSDRPYPAFLAWHRANCFKQ